MFDYYNEQRIEKKALFAIKKKKIKAKKNVTKAFY